MKLNEVREKLRSDNYICFTTDLDWAPEEAIKKTLDVLIGNELKPTVFVTHQSKVIEEYANKIDLGIHPNFIQPSSQGENPEAIVDTLENIVPNTKVFRCHRWFSSNDVYDLLKKRGFEYESNLCTNMDLAEPFLHRSGMISFPTFFEDGAYIADHNRFDFEKEQKLFLQNGLKIINMHPMHYALNTPFFQYTRDIKDRLTREEWNGMSKDTLAELEYKELGIRSFIDDLISFTKQENVKIVSLKEVYNWIER